MFGVYLAPDLGPILSRTSCLRVYGCKSALRELQIRYVGVYYNSVVPQIHPSAHIEPLSRAVRSCLGREHWYWYCMASVSLRYLSFLVSVGRRYVIQ